MRVSLNYIGIIVGTLIAALGVTLLVMRIIRWRRDIALREHGAPVLVMPMGDDTVTPRPARPRPDALREAAAEPIDPEFASRPTPIASRTLPNETTLEHARDADRIDTGPFRPGEVRPGSPSAHLVAGSQVRFFRAEEGTLEFLPGFLEVVGGEDIGQEIRFARQLGESEATVTFGRAEGAPLRHVQLLDPTVSRQHASLTFANTIWSLQNHSTTNPVVVNDASLTDGAAMPLSDGDRIEMGAVVFVFHER